MHAMRTHAQSAADQARQLTEAQPVSSLAGVAGATAPVC